MKSTTNPWRARSIRLPIAPLKIIVMPSDTRSRPRSASRRRRWRRCQHGERRQHERLAGEVDGVEHAEQAGVLHLYVKFSRPGITGTLSCSGNSRSTRAFLWLRLPPAPRPPRSRPGARPSPWSPAGPRSARPRSSSEPGPASRPRQHRPHNPERLVGRRDLGHVPPAAHALRALGARDLYLQFAARLALGQRHGRSDNTAAGRRGAR